MRFDTTDLRLFVNIVDAGTITAGATRLRVTLASASVRPCDLETRFGIPLLCCSEAICNGDADPGIGPDAIDQHHLPAGRADAAEDPADEAFVGLPCDRAPQDHVDAHAHRLGAAPRRRLRAEGSATVGRPASRPPAGGGLNVAPSACLEMEERDPRYVVRAAL